MSTLDDRFSSKDFRLDKLLEDIEDGHLQIPKFQRDLVWDRNDIHSLLASISLAYPIGSLLLLKAQGDDVRFEPRQIGIDPLTEDQKRNVTHYVLDGQQRLTALFMALREKHNPKLLKQKGKRTPYIYYLDIQKALETSPELEEEYRDGAIQPERLTEQNWDTIRVFADPENVLNVSEYRSNKFPLHLLFDDRRVHWLDGYTKYRCSKEGDRDESAVVAEIDGFKKTVLNNFLMYEIPATVISETAPWGTVCRMFERINSTGRKLSVFDLLVARYAVHKLDLHKEMKGILEKFSTYKVLSNIRGIDVLRTITLMATARNAEAGHPHCGNKGDGTSVSCTNDAVLKLGIKDFQTLGLDAANAFVQVGKYLERNGMWVKDDVPFRPQLITFAAVLSTLPNNEDQEMWSKLDRWYWCSVFAGTYGRSTNERCAQDMVRLTAWIRDGEKSSDQLPRGIIEVRVDAGALVRQIDRRDATYRGIISLMKTSGVIDFVSGEPLQDSVHVPKNGVNLHHMFPKKYCRDTLRKVDLWDSIINQVPLSGKSNRELGSKSPDEQIEYLRTEKNLDDEEIKSRLSRFDIKFDVIDGRDDFERFFLHRATEISKLITTVTGKEVENFDKVVDAVTGIGGKEGSERCS